MDPILIAIALWLLTGKSSDVRNGASAPGSASDFIKRFYNYAQSTQQYFQVPTLFTLAQAGLESAWGNSPLAVNANNYFGIKADSSWHGPTYTTYGSDAATYRKYASAQESFNDHAKFLTGNSRYASAFSTTDALAFAKAVAAAGYATAPNYASALTAVINSVSAIVGKLGL